MPPPDNYNVTLNLLNLKKNNHFVARSPRITLFEEIIKFNKTRGVPHSTLYSKNFSAIESGRNTAATAMRLKEEKGLFLSDSYIKAKICNGDYKPNYSSVEREERSCIKLYPSKEKPILRFKPKKSDLPTVGTYNDQEAFKRTQEKNRKFFTQKSEVPQIFE